MSCGRSCRGGRPRCPSRCRSGTLWPRHGWVCRVRSTSGTSANCWAMWRRPRRRMGCWTSRRRRRSRPRGRRLSPGLERRLRETARRSGTSAATVMHALGHPPELDFVDMAAGGRAHLGVLAALPPSVRPGSGPARWNWLPARRASTPGSPGPRARPPGSGPAFRQRMARQRPPAGDRPRGLRRPHYVEVRTGWGGTPGRAVKAEDAGGCARGGRRRGGHGGLTERRTPRPSREGPRGGRLPPRGGLAAPWARWPRAWPSRWTTATPGRPPRGRHAHGVPGRPGGPAGARRQLDLTAHVAMDALPGTLTPSAMPCVPSASPRPPAARAGPPRPGRRRRPGGHHAGRRITAEGGLGDFLWLTTAAARVRGPARRSVSTAVPGKGAPGGLRG